MLYMLVKPCMSQILSRRLICLVMQAGDFVPGGAPRYNRHSWRDWQREEHPDPPVSPGSWVVLR